MGSDTCLRSLRVTAMSGFNMFKFSFNSDKALSSFLEVNRPHTAHGPSIKFSSLIASEKPLMTESNIFLLGGGGGNLASTFTVEEVSLSGKSLRWR